MGTRCIGAAIITLLPNLFTVFYKFEDFVEGLLLILVILVLPGGIYSIFEKIREKRSAKPASAVQVASKPALSQDWSAGQMSQRLTQGFLKALLLGRA